MTAPRLCITPYAAALDQRLERGDLAVLMLLGGHIDSDGWCSRSQVRMAKQLRCGRATVQRAIRRLVETGYVEQRAMVRENGATRASEYRVLLDGARPAAFINDIDESEEADGAGEAEVETVAAAAEGADPLPTSGHPLPMGGHPLPAHERAPMLTIPLKRSEEREARVRGSERAGARAAERRAETIAAEAAAARADAEFMKLIDGWETAAADDLLTPWRAWQRLDGEDRAAALERAAAYQAYRRAVLRKAAMGLASYLGQRLWTLLPAYAAAGGARPADPTLQIGPFNRAWWAWLHGRIAAGERVAFAVGQAREGRSALVRASAAPDAAAEAALVRLDRDGAAAAAWLAHFAARQAFRLAPADIRAPFVWMPAAWPPGDPRAGAPPAVFDAADVAAMTRG